MRMNCKLIKVSLMLPPAAFGQINADATGNVTDASGGIVRGATVTALQVDTQAKKTAVTNDAGQYSLSELPLGEYTITAEAQGPPR